MNEGILDIINANKQVFEPFGDLVDSALLHLRTNIAHKMMLFLGKRMTKSNKNC